MSAGASVGDKVGGCCVARRRRLHSRTQEQPVWVGGALVSEVVCDPVAGDRHCRMGDSGAVLTRRCRAYVVPRPTREG